MTISILYVRTSDNVLEDEDYPVRLIVIEENKVKQVVTLNDGVYGTWGMPSEGWSLREVMDWSAYDNTGHHPECYHEVTASPAIGAEWKTTLDVSAAADLLEKGRDTLGSVEAHVLLFRRLREVPAGLNERE